MQVSLDQARRFVLETQGLRTPNPSKSILEVARRIHNIQIDTISVVTRSHNLITYNRFNDYSEGDVWQAQRDGKLFEYWSHALCLLPIESFPFYAWVMQFYPEMLWKQFMTWAADNGPLIEEVYKTVKKNGPTASQEIGERKETSRGWWDLKAERWALEYLFFQGRLMVSYRKGFQKHYDLTERVLPSGIDSEPMDVSEVPHYMFDTIFRSLGIASSEEVKTYMGRRPARHLWNGRKKTIETVLLEFCSEGLLEEVQISGMKDKHFVHTNHVERLNGPFEEFPGDLPVKLLSPFDNIMRDRPYPHRLWDFEYKIECYVPPPKRVYGYYVLPILDGHDIGGRLDAKVHRKDRILEIKSIFLESDTMKNEAGMGRLKAGIERFAGYHGCQTTTVGKVSPRKATSKVRSLLAG